MSEASNNHSDQNRANRSRVALCLRQAIFIQIRIELIDLECPLSETSNIYSGQNRANRSRVALFLRQAVFIQIRIELIGLEWPFV